MRHEEGTFAGVGGVEIFHQAWRPDDEPRSVVLLAHGASEHSGRYAWTGERLAERGHAVHALDHRGHGRSGSGAYVDRLDNAVADLHRLAGLASDGYPDTPVFLLGHSMGGAVALAYAFRHQAELDGLVLSAPLAKLEAASPVTRAIGLVLSRLAPRTPVFAIDSGAVSRDPEVVRDYDADPLNHHGKLPARTVAELTEAVGRFEARLPELTLPILALHGTGDTLTPPEGSEMVCRLSSSDDKTHKTYEGLYHEILNEPERDEVLDDIASWIEARAPARAAA
jgi:alpha-beta hydrolase superfamily lysophospholipase